MYPILDTASLEARNLALPAAAAALLEGGAGILQIRHKAHWSRDLFAAAQQVARLCREAGADLIVNDRADFALLLEAGLHVGQDDLSPRDARKLMGSEPAIGFSSHNVNQLSAAGGEPVDYVALGPIFATASKRNPDPVVGVEELRRCRALVDQPLVAIGGITRDNALAVLDAGADSVAVIAGLFPAGAATPQSLRQRMEEWQQLVESVSPQPEGLVKGLGLLSIHHAGDGLDDRLGHLHRGRGYRAPGAVAGAADRDLGCHRGAHPDRGAELRRTGGRHAARGRPVRLPARGVRPAERIPLRLDAVHGDPDRHHRGGGRGVRQVHAASSSRRSPRSTICWAAAKSGSPRSNCWPSP